MVDTDSVRIPDVEIGPVIGRGAHATVYRGVARGQDVAIKVERSTTTPASALAAFRREAAALARVRHAGLPKILDAGETAGRAYLILELVNGQTLGSLLRNGPLPEDAAVDLVITITGALGELHRFGLVHRDVKPDNVVLRLAGGATLIDLGFAAEAQRSDGADGLAGTLLYSAPEQIGTLGRPIDGRSDLYSLGVTLFECLTGRPPFDAGLDLVHAHTVLPPPSIRDLAPNVSPALAVITAKLLAKDPDDRYQTAAALVADLLDHEAIDRQLAGGRPVALGAAGPAEAPSHELPLVGRTVELAQIRDVWTQAAAGHGGVLVIEGPAGVGKSRLARELVHSSEADGARVLQATAVAVRTKPLAPVREAIDRLIAEIGRLPADEAATATAAIVDAAGRLEPLLRRISPELGRLVMAADEQTADGPPDSRAAPEQVRDAIAEFLRRFAASQPLLLLLDDVQWLDDGSRRVLRQLASQIADLPLLIVLTARPGPAIDRLAGELGPALLVHLMLQPLGRDALGEMVQSYLAGLEVEPAAIDQVIDLSQGNPFTAVECLIALLEAGALRPSWGRWIIDRERSRALELPADVAQIVVRRIHDLAPETVRLLSIAAVAGSRFHLSVLVQATGMPAAVVASAIAEAVQAGLIDRHGPGQYGFTHDRFRDALLDRLDEPATCRAHLAIAQALTAVPAPSPDARYEIARHYALAGPLADARLVYETSLDAGLLAADESASEAAYDFLDEARRAAGRAGIDLPPILDRALGEVCAHAGRWSEAIERLARARDRTDDRYERADLRTRLAEVHFANRDTANAWHEIDSALAELGQPLGRSDAFATARLVAGWLTTRWFERTRLGFGAARADERARLRSLARVYYAAAQVAYLDNRRVLLATALIRLMRAAQRLGTPHELAQAYAGWGLLLALAGRPTDAARATRQALRAAEQSESPVLQANALVAEAWVLQVAGESTRAEALMRQVMETRGVWVDARYHHVACTSLGWSQLLRGYCQEGARWVRRAIERADATSRQRASLLTDNALFAAILGRPAEARSLLAEARQVADETPDERWRWSDYIARATMVAVELDDLGATLDEMIELHRKLDLTPRRSILHARHFYVFQAYARLQQCLRAAVAERLVRRQQLREALDQLEQAATHPTLRCHYLALEGGYRRLAGDVAGATRLLAEAEALATSDGNLWVIFEVARHRAHLMADAGATDAAVQQARLALQLATEQGWVNRARWVRSELQLPLSLPTTRGWGSAAGTARRSSGGQGRREKRQLDALLQVSLATAREHDPERQARVALDEIIRILGAERAFLFLFAGPERTLSLEAGRNAQGRDLVVVEDYSRTVVQSVVDSREPLVFSGAPGRPLSAADSIVTHDLRSIVAVPILLQDRLLGIVYLDNRLARGVFTEEDVDILTAIANHIGIAFETAAAFARQAALADENASLLDQLRDQIDEIERSRALISAADERLRRDISELLHSRVQTRLVVVWHQLGMCQSLFDVDPARAKALLEEVRQTIDDIRENEVRQASHLLHPSIIRIGLVPAIRSLSQRFAESFAVSLDVGAGITLLDDPVDNAIPEPTRLVVYRALEEAFGNITKHAAAKLVAIRLDIDAENRLTLTVRDDGSGFDPTTLKPGLGLSSLSSRVGQAGGSWRIESAPGIGTTLHIELPIEPPETATSQQERFGNAHAD